MTTYTAPVADMRFLQHELLSALRAAPERADLDSNVVDDVLREAGRFCAVVLLPLNQSGDLHGCSFEDGIVRAPPGFREAYRQFVEGGWPSIHGSAQYGGQDLPTSIHVLVDEMMSSANMAFANYVGLTSRACKVIERDGSAEQRSLYLPKLISGSWTATMCLTEPQCGTDLGLVRTRAEPHADGSYRITGAKIFISGGEHDLTCNIVHLVLARIKGAPGGTAGLSLFVVPKLLPDGTEGPSVHNTVRCTAVEHKMGLRGAATCAMSFDGATGWLIGEPNRGMRLMFTMMNGARLLVAAQSVGLGELAYQSALQYAKERRQGRAPGGARYPHEPADPIIVHPDVRRNLLTMKAMTEGVRALVLWLAANHDRAGQAADERDRREADDLVQLLTPVAKSFATDAGFEIANIGVQIYGGHGYVRDHGMEQIVRDARVAQLYEGTNGVQAMDLVGRKILGDDGARLEALYQLIGGLIEDCSSEPAMQPFIQPLISRFERLQRAVATVVYRSRVDPREIGAVAADLQDAFGYVTVGFLWAHMARLALRRLGGDTSGFYRGKVQTARYYMEHLLPRADACLAAVLSGGASVTDAEDDLFDAAVRA